MVYGVEFIAECRCKQLFVCLVLLRPFRIVGRDFAGQRHVRSLGGDKNVLMLLRCKRLPLVRRDQASSDAERSIHINRSARAIRLFHVSEWPPSNIQLTGLDLMTKSCLLDPSSFDPPWLPMNCVDYPLGLLDQAGELFQGR